MSLVTATQVTPNRSTPTVVEFEPYRRELTAHCYRMLASGSEAEDAVQETMLRAWQSSEQFEGRSSVRTWLYRIATNVCIDMGRSRQRRAHPIDLGPARTPDPVHLADVLAADAWITPVADAAVLDLGADPAELTVQRDSIRLAFVSALQRLPARQRAALVLCDVLRWPAADVAELLDTSTASINSALQRARAVLAQVPASAPTEPPTDEQRRILDRYVDAFERYDMDALTALLHDDVIQTMPPYAMWLQGSDDLVAWYTGAGIGCAGSRLLRGEANGCPAFAQYRIDPDGGHEPWALQVVELRGARIEAIHAFLGTEAFERFGFPAHLD
jgi:RNA polymerase sigma-70 factor (ECF subfamily)